MEDDSIDISEFRQQRNADRIQQQIEFYGIKPYEEIREHYIQRLNERYNMVISNSEYDELLERIKLSDYIKIYSLSFNRKIIWIKIRDTYVLSIYNRRVKDLRVGVLLTCLNFEGLRMPVPKMFGINGFKPHQFEECVNRVITESFKYVDDYNEMGTKDFFMKHPADSGTKSFIYTWSKTGTVDLDKVIDYLYNKCMKDDTFKIKEIKY